MTSLAEPESSFIIFLHWRYWLMISLNMTSLRKVNTLYRKQITVPDLQAQRGRTAMCVLATWPGPSHPILL